MRTFLIQDKVSQASLCFIQSPQLTTGETQYFEFKRMLKCNVSKIQIIAFNKFQHKNKRVIFSHKYVQSIHLWYNHIEARQFPMKNIYSIIMNKQYNEEKACLFQMLLSSCTLSSHNDPVMLFYVLISKRPANAAQYTRSKTNLMANLGHKSLPFELVIG